uniref:Gamma-aminobutyric acid receptor subunit beta n=1 Tax=Caenorhabditis japonica TaxID=281687 RepID=A0A8R1DVB9_CAEJA
MPINLEVTGSNLLGCKVVFFVVTDVFFFLFLFLYTSSSAKRVQSPPIEVNITAHITTISAVSEVSMDYTLDLYLRQIWKDPRLAWESDLEDSLTIGIDMVKTIWTPDTFFPNEKKSFFHEATSHNSFLRIDNHGNVLRSIRLTVTANCPMSLHTSYGYSTKDIIYHWHSANAVTIDENVHLAHFTIGEHYHIERTISLSTGNYSRLTAYFTFKRNIGFYLIQIYFPSSLIVVISWVSFWLNREAVQARVAIGVTTVLTMTTLMTSTNASLPKVSYVKSLDVFLGVCFFIVFASLLEYAAIGYLMKRNRSVPAASPVQYYETGDGVLKREASRKKNRNRRESSAKNYQNNNIHHRPSDGHVDQRIPLLSMVPMPPIPFKPENSRTWGRVDLFSRFAFPIFFVIFHIIYWTYYINQN